MSVKRSLTIVCCHAVFTGAPQDDPFDERKWILKPFQKGDGSTGKVGEHTVFIEHLRRAVNCWQQDGNGVLIFSGGATEKFEWDGSEAKGYLNVLNVLYPGIEGKDRILLEEHATDTYQNILFSILLCHKAYGEWPDSCTIVTHSFKRHRIVDVHARALKWPSSRINFQGIDPPFSSEERGFVERAEKKCCEDWDKDMYGVRPPLRQKRLERCFCEREILVLSEDGDARGLLVWDGGCEPSSLYPDQLPWEKMFDKTCTT